MVRHPSRQAGDRLYDETRVINYEMNRWLRLKSHPKMDGQTLHCHTVKSLSGGVSSGFIEDMCTMVMAPRDKRSSKVEGGGTT